MKDAKVKQSGGSCALVVVTERSKEIGKYLSTYPHKHNNNEKFMYSKNCFSKVIFRFSRSFPLIEGLQIVTTDSP